MLESREIPQANSLEDVIVTVFAVANGANTYQQIAQAIGKGERQGRYYRLAAEQIGLIAPCNTNHSILTALGQEFISLSQEQREVLLAELILRNPSINMVFGEIVRCPGITRGGLANLIIRNGNGIGESLAYRRCATIIAWLTELKLIMQQNGAFVALWQPAFGGQAVFLQEDAGQFNGRQSLLNELEDVWIGNFSENNGNITYEVSRDLREQTVRNHQLLVKQMVGLIRLRGAVPKCSKYIDLAAQLPEGNYFFEMKTFNQQNLVNQMRKGISQLYEYRYRYSLVVQNPSLWLVLEQPIQDGWYIDYLVRDRGINLCWKAGDSFDSPELCRMALSQLKSG